MNPCDCKDNYADESSLSFEDLQKDQNNGCPVIVNETVTVQAEVTITPDVRVGNVKVLCKDGATIKKCFIKSPRRKKCTFDVAQKICVEIPLIFSATADAIPKGVICGTPGIGKCSKKKKPCWKFPLDKVPLDFLKKLLSANAILPMKLRNQEQ